MSTRRFPVPVQATDGHRFELLATVPADAHSRLLWLPALGVPARHYQPLADALAVRGVATFVHEWRGIGSSDVRASRENDWGYRELLTHDLPGSHRVAAGHAPALPQVIGDTASARSSQRATWP